MDALTLECEPLHPRPESNGAAWPSELLHLTLEIPRLEACGGSSSCPSPALVSTNAALGAVEGRTLHAINRSKRTREYALCAVVFHLEFLFAKVLPMQESLIPRSPQQRQILHQVVGSVFCAFSKVCCCHHRTLVAGALTLLRLTT